MTFQALAATHNSALFMAGIVVLLLTATLIHTVLQKIHPQKNFDDLRLRTRSWWIMIAVLFAALLGGRTIAIVFFALLSYLALKEFMSIIPTRQVDRRAVFWAYLAIPFQYYWVADAWYAMFIVFIPVFMFLVIPTRLVLTGETQGFIKATATIHLGLMIAVFSISHLAYLIALRESTNPAGGNIGLVLYVLFLTQFNDVAQYVWGKTLGRHKISPRVSPNKTWEGFLGGVATTTTLGVVFAGFLTPMTALEGAMAGLLIGVGGFFGDLAMSAIKRDLRIKDTSALIPGHGGILDRIDSLVFSAPLFFHFIGYLYY